MTLLAVTFGVLPAMVAQGAPSCGVQLAAAPFWLSGGKDLGGGVSAQSSCSATCAGGTTISTSSCPGTCTAADINCPNTQGYVSCNGVVTYCAIPCCTVGCDYCEAVNGSTCSPRNATRHCTGSDLGDYTCHCGFGNTWVCPY